MLELDGGVVTAGVLVPTALGLVVPLLCDTAVVTALPAAVVVDSPVAGAAVVPPVDLVVFFKLSSNAVSLMRSFSARMARSLSLLASSDVIKSRCTRRTATSRTWSTVMRRRLFRKVAINAAKTLLVALLLVFVAGFVMGGVGVVVTAVLFVSPVLSVEENKNDKPHIYWQ